MDNFFSGDKMKKLLGDAQKMQAEMEATQKSLGAMRITGSAGGGMVRVTMSGERKITNIEINKDSLDDKDMLQDLMAAACNDALAKTEAEIQKAMQSSLSGMLGKML